MKKRELKIGEVAKIAGVNVGTIRYYERLGLIPEPSRTESIWGHGYRQYTTDVLIRLMFIREAKRIGFTLKEIKELLSLRVDEKTNCKAVRTMAEAKLQEVEDKLRSLRKIGKSLQELITACRKGKQTDHCPILNAMDKSYKDIKIRR